MHHLPSLLGRQASASRDSDIESKNRKRPVAIHPPSQHPQHQHQHHHRQQQQQQQQLFDDDDRSWTSSHVHEDSRHSTPQQDDTGEDNDQNQEKIQKQEEQIDFLTNQVHRLNHILVQYQQQYPTLAPDEKLLSEHLRDDVPLWIVQRSFLNPLLAEYDSTIVKLRQQVQESQNGYQELVDQAIQLQEENKALHETLRTKIDQAITNSATQRTLPTPGASAPPKSQTSPRLLPPSPSIFEQQEMKDELESLEALLGHHKIENDALRQSCAVNENLVKALQSRLDDQIRLTNTMQDDLMEAERSAQAHQSEVESLRSVVETKARDSSANYHLEEQLSQLHIRVQQLTEQQQLDSVQLQRSREDLARQQTQHDLLKQKLHQRDETNRQLETKCKTLDNEIQTLQARLHELTQNNDQLHQTIGLLETNIGTIEMRERTAAAKSQDLQDRLDKEELEKEKADLRVLQAEESAERAWKQVAEAKSQAARNMEHERLSFHEQLAAQARLTQTELAESEQKCISVTTELSRCKREKGIAEKETARLRQQLDEHSAAQHQSLRELQQKLEQVVEERNNVLVLSQKAALQSQRAQSLCENEARKNLLVLEETKRRLSHVEKECSRLQEEQLKLLSQLASAERENAAIRTREASALHAASATQERHQQEKQMMRARLLEEVQQEQSAREREVQELTMLLHHQTELCAKWRDESRQITERYRVTTDAANNVRSGLLKQITALSSRVSELSAQNHALESACLRTQMTETLRIPNYGQESVK